MTAQPTDAQMVELIQARLDFEATITQDNASECFFAMKSSNRILVEALTAYGRPVNYKDRTFFVKNGNLEMVYNAKHLEG